MTTLDATSPDNPDIPNSIAAHPLGQIARRAAAQPIASRHQAGLYSYQERLQLCLDAVQDEYLKDPTLNEYTLAWRGAYEVYRRAASGNERMRLESIQLDALGTADLPEERADLLDDISPRKTPPEPWTRPKRARRHRRARQSLVEARQLHSADITPEERSKALRTALAQMSRSEREVLWGLKAEGKTQAEIATELLMDQSNVSRHYRTAREHFIKLYCDQLDLDPARWLKQAECKAELKRRDAEYRRWRDGNPANNRPYPD